MESQKNPRMAQIQKLLERHQSRYAHNKLPFEKSLFLQLVHNPLNNSQFISVQQIKRLKAVELGIMGGANNAAEEAKKATTNFVAQMLAGGKSAAEVASRITQDRGKGFYQYEYETCKSKGPSRNDKFTDPDKQLEGTGDGTWVSDYIEPKCKEQTDKVREFLIIAFWEFNELEDSIKMLREYVIDKPYAPMDNVRPLHISEQAECAYWFEVNNMQELVYCEVSLINEGDPLRSSLRTVQELKDQLSNPEMTFTFTLNRINTKQGEPILVYSRPKDTGSRKRSSVRYDASVVNISTKATTASASLSQRLKTQAESSSNLLINTSGKHQSQSSGDSQSASGSQDSLVELRFFSLQHHKQIFKIDNADSLLEYDQESNDFWVLHIKTEQGQQIYRDAVSHIKWDRQKQSPDQSDVLKTFVTDTNDSDIFNYRRAGLQALKSVDIYFSAQFYKLVLISQNKIATIYHLSDQGSSPDPKQGILRKQQFFHLMSQVYIGKGTSDQEVYLVQVKAKDVRDLSREQLKKIPDNDSIYEMFLFDILNSNPDKPLEPQFPLTCLIKKDFGLGNKCYQNGLYLNKDLEVHGPMLDGDRHCFGFIRSYVKDEGPIVPQIYDNTYQVRYPILVMRTPHPSSNKVFIESFYHPEKVRILDLGAWTYICGVENVLKTPEKGQIQPFSALVRSPAGQICLVMFRVNPFEIEIDKYVKWEVLGVLKSINQDPIMTDKIIGAKLLQCIQGDHLSIVVQYDGELLALKLDRHLHSREERDKLRMKVNRTFALSAIGRNHNDRQTVGAVRGRTNHNSNFMSQTLDEVDPFKKRNVDYEFGEKLCPRTELLAKSILLSKNGLKVYFLKRDVNKKSDEIMSVELLPSRPDSNENDLEVKVEKVYESADARIIYFNFDHMIEQIGLASMRDAFYILDSQKRILRITESHQIAEQEDGLNFQKSSCYKIQNTVNLEEKLGAKTINSMNIAKIFNMRYPQFNITMRSIQFKGQTIGFDSDQFMPTMGKGILAQEVFALRGTMYMGGYYKQDRNGSHIFFAKSNMGARAIDCLGLRGPTPTQQHIVGNGLVMFTWKDYFTNKEKTTMFNNAGRYLGVVTQPKNVNPNSAKTLEENLVPIKQSYDCQYYLLERKNGFKMVEGQRVEESLICIAKLLQNAPTGQYHFSEIKKLEPFANVKTSHFQIDQNGYLYSLSLKYHKELNDKIYGQSKLNKDSNWVHMDITLPMLPFDEDDPNGKYQEKLGDVHVDLTKNFVALIRRNGTIIKINHHQLTDKEGYEKNQAFELEWSTVNLPINKFIEDKSKVDEIGIKWMFVDDLVQFKLSICLIQYDLMKQREVACLNNYQGAFDDSSKFVLSPFFIPVTTQDKQGRLVPTRNYINVSLNENFVLPNQDRLKGRIYTMHDELTLYNMQSIVRKCIEGKKINKIDPILLQSTYMGEAVFHLCYNQFSILECLHKQVCGSKIPGEVGDVNTQQDPTAQVTSKDNMKFSQHVSFEKPWFRRIVQLLIRKDANGDTPLNLAIRNKSFRCFELMLSILLNATDAFVSRSFLKDLGYMIEIEATTVDQFFNSKLVDNLASKKIEKVKWTIDKDSIGILVPSQLITKDQIELHTCPPDKSKQEEESSKDEKTEESKFFVKPTMQIHQQLEQQQLSDPNMENGEASMKNVDVKLLDMDWFFQDGNGRRLIWMLAMTNHEELFQTRQVTTIIDLFWEKYQQQIFKKVFMPYVIYFSSALIYFTFFLRDVEYNVLTHSVELSLRMLVVSNMIIFQAIEGIQVQASGLSEYFKDFWNVLDQLSFFANATTLILHKTDSSIPSQKTAAAISIFLLYIKFFYWLRLFDSTAAFIRMLREIIQDIVPFLTFLVVCVSMFANTFLIFDQSRRLQGRFDERIIEPVFSIPWLDAFVRSYLVGLGEFGIDNYTGEGGALIWLFFLLATFITQLLFMNLLIAIMGDTFDRVQEVKVQAAAKEKISMITDFIWVLDLQEEFGDAKYVVIVEQQTISDNANVWEGKIGQLKAYIGHQTRSMSQQTILQFTELKLRMSQSDYQNRLQQERIQGLNNAVEQISHSYKKNKHSTQNQLASVEHKLDQILSHLGHAPTNSQGMSTTGPTNRMTGGVGDGNVSRAEAANALRATGFIPGASNTQRGNSIFNDFNTSSIKPAPGRR